MKIVRQLLSDRSGVAALEFALLGLPFILLLLGLVEFGRGLHIRSALDAAADRAQRMIIIDPSANATTLEKAIRDTFQAGQPDRLNIAYAADMIDGTTYRLISLDYPMELLLPAPLGRTLIIRSARRVVLLD